MIGRSAARRERAAYRLMQRLGAERFGEQRGVGGHVLDGIGLAVAGDEQDRLIAELQEDVGCRSRLSKSRRSSPRRSWAQEVRESRESVHEEGRYRLSFPVRWLIPRPDLLPDQIRSHSRFAMMPTLASIAAAASRQMSSR